MKNCNSKNMVFCWSCKHHKDIGFGHYTDYVCKLHWKWNCDTMSKWKTYAESSKINKNNDCPKFELDFIGRMLRYIKKFIRKIHGK